MINNFPSWHLHCLACKMSFAVIFVAVLAIIGTVSDGFELSFQLSEAEQIRIRKQPKAFENIVAGLINKLQQSLKEVDPITIDEVSYNLNEGLSKMQFKAKNVTISGFSNFELNSLKISVIGLRAVLQLHFEKMGFSVKSYDFDAKMAFLPFYGTGDVNVDVFNVTVDGRAAVSIFGTTGIKNLNFNTTLGAIKADVTGVLRNEELDKLTKDLVEETAVLFFNSHTKRFGELLGPVIEAFINSILKGSGNDKTDAS